MCPRQSESLSRIQAAKDAEQREVFGVLYYLDDREYQNQTNETL